MQNRNGRSAFGQVKSFVRGVSESYVEMRKLQREAQRKFPYLDW